MSARWFGLQPEQLDPEQRALMMHILLDLHRAVVSGAAAQPQAGLLARVAERWCGCTPEELPTNARLALVEEILLANRSSIFGGSK